MNYTLLAFYSNIFGFIIDSISLLNLIVTKLEPHLPRNKIKVMDVLLHETETTLMETVEEGLLVHEFAQVAEHRLHILQEDARGIRLEAHKITTLCQDYMGFILGKSAVIGTTCDSLSRLRAEVIISSEERRRRLQEMSWIPAIVCMPPTRSPMTNLGPKVPPAAWIPPPSSCPPVRLVCQSIDRAIDGDPFGDSTQIDSDARTTDAFSKTSLIHTPVNLEPEA